MKAAATTTATSMSPRPSRTAAGSAPASPSPARPVRVAMLVPSLRGGGLERLVRDLAVTLDPLSYRVAVFCVGGLGVHADALRAADIDVYDCREPTLRIRGLPLRLLRAVSGFAPDVIHAHSGTWYPAAVVKTLLRTPRLIYTDHGRYPPEGWGRSVVERWCAARTDATLAVSSSLSTYLKAFLRLPAAPAVVPNGIELDAYAPIGPDRRASLRREWGFNDDDVVAISVGRFAPVKNHGLMLEAFAACAAGEARLRLLLLGAGALEPELRERARSLEIEQLVHFGGFRQDIGHCMRASDLFLMSSDTEGLPVALLEAMASGLPIVSTAVGDVPTLVGGDPPAGLLVQAGDGAALAEALDEMASDPSARARFGQAASRHAREFSLGAMADAYAALYHEQVEGMA